MNRTLSGLKSDAIAVFTSVIKWNVHIEKNVSRRIIFGEKCKVSIGKVTGYLKVLIYKIKGFSGIWLPRSFLLT